MGRKKTSIPFEQAKEIVQAERIGSVAQYKTWHNLNKPAGIPKRPDRAYIKEFTTWNDFLGNNTPFPIKFGRYRPYKEAKAFAQSLNISKRKEWFAMCDAGGLPEDIPRRPDLYYRKKEEWVSWPNFLGVTLLSREQTILEMDTIFFIVHNPNADHGYFRCGLTNGGVSSINDFTVKINGKLLLAYYVPNTFSVEKFLDQFDSYEHYEHKNYYKIMNLTPIVSKLSIEYNKVNFQS